MEWGKKPKLNGKPITTSLTDYVKMWPTPAARDYRGSHAKDSESFIERQNHPRGVNLVEEMQRRTEQPGSLNPDWVEWLMGYPPGYTNLTSQESQPE